MYCSALSRLAEARTSQPCSIETGVHAFRMLFPIPEAGVVIIMVQVQITIAGLALFILKCAPMKHDHACSMAEAYPKSPRSSWREPLEQEAAPGTGSIVREPCFSVIEVSGGGGSSVVSSALV